MKKLSFRIILNIVFIATILLIVAVSIYSFYTIKDYSNDAKWVNHSHEVLLHLEKMISSMKDAETAQRGFLFLQDQEILEPYYGAKERVKYHLGSVFRLTKGVEVEQDKLMKIQELIEERFSLMENVKLADSVLSTRSSFVEQLFLEGDSIMDELRHRVTEIENEEERLLNQRLQETEISSADSHVVIGMYSGFTLLIAFFAFGGMNVEFKKRSKAQKELLKSNLQFQAIFNQTFQFLGLLDSDGRLIDINQTALDFGGLKKDEVVGKYIWETPYWSTSEQTVTDLKEALQKANEGQFVRYEVDIVGERKQVVTVDFSIKPILDADERITMLITEGRDITEQKRIQEEKTFLSVLQSEVSLTDNFQEAVKVILMKISQRYGLDYGEIWLTAPGSRNKLEFGAVCYVSHTKYKDFFYESCKINTPSADGLAQRVSDNVKFKWLPDLSEADENVFKRQKMALQLGLKTAFGVPVAAGTEMIGVLVFLASELKKENLKIVSSIETLTFQLGEILKRKKAENEVQRNEAMLSEAEKVAQVGSWEWQISSNKVIWSDGLYNIYGKDKKTFDLTFESYIECIHPDDREQLQEKVMEAVANHQPYTVDHRILLENGEVRYISGAGYPRFDSEGNLMEFFGTAKDVTEIKAQERKLKEAADQLKLSNEELRRSNEDLEQFAYVASHDLQEPLRKIRAFGDRLQLKYEKGKDMPGKEYVDRMQNASKRMQVLIDDLLTFSRVSRRTGELEEVDMNAVVRVVLDDLEHRIEDTHAEVQLEDLPVIKANHSQMRQLFQNLISNAIKFGKEGQRPVVKISSRQVLGRNIPYREIPAREGKVYYEIKVNDNGIGFDEKYLNRIFTIFQRLHGRSTYEGTGIGLAVCKKIIENHNGFITARSEPCKGATFILYLPK